MWEMYKIFYPRKRTWIKKPCLKRICDTLARNWLSIIFFWYMVMSIWTFIFRTPQILFVGFIHLLWISSEVVDSRKRAVRWQLSKGTVREKLLQLLKVSVRVEYTLIVCDLHIKHWLKHRSPASGKCNKDS